MTVKNIWRTSLHLFTILLLIFLLGIRISNMTGIETYQIMSGSMEPTLEVGDLVMVNTKDRDVEVGDMIAFYKGNQVVVHRAVQIIEECYYKTKGDSNEIEDFGLISDVQLIGITQKLPDMAAFIWKMMTSNLIYGVIICMAILHIITELVCAKSGGAVIENS